MINLQTDQSMMVIELCAVPFFQIPVNCRLTQTQPTGSLVYQTTTGRWPMWRRTSSTWIIRTDLTSGPSCCVKMLWPAAVTGRWNGEERLTFPWVTEKSAGREMMVTLCLEWMTTPGVCSALKRMVFLSVTIQTEHLCPTPLSPPPCQIEWRYMWIILPACFHSTWSHWTH